MGHALSTEENPRCSRSWIIDSGATSHICNDCKQFLQLYPLKNSLEVVLGDGHKLTAVAQGTVKVLMKYGHQGSRKCILHDVLYIPELSYNLLSVSKAVERGNSIKFGKSSCIIRDSNNKPIAVAEKIGGLYQVSILLQFMLIPQIRVKRQQRRIFGTIDLDTIDCKEPTKVSQRQSC